MKMTHNIVTLTENGVITLPEAIRQKAGLMSGDELVLIWLPPETILVRKLSEVALDDSAFEIVMREFDQALRSAGYETEEDIIQLIREIKAEQVNEWKVGR